MVHLCLRLLADALDDDGHSWLQSAGGNHYICLNQTTAAMDTISDELRLKKHKKILFFH